MTGDKKNPIDWAEANPGAAAVVAERVFGEMASHTQMVAALERVAIALASDRRIQRAAGHMTCMTGRQKLIAIDAAIRSAYPPPVPTSPELVEPLGCTLFGPDADDMAATAGALCRAASVPFRIVVARTSHGGLTCWVRAEVEPDVWIDINPQKETPPCPSTPAP